MVGRHELSAIGTLVCRATVSSVWYMCPIGPQGGEDFAAALAAAVGDRPPITRRTLTWDQGSEMARQDLLAHLYDEGIYFADPGSPWQRGTNENTNGLLRQYVPKREAHRLARVRPRRPATGRGPCQQSAAQELSLGQTGNGFRRSTVTMITQAS
ncbi:IS30 family transposase [Rhodococcus opacus]|uniref:IS30 family transposase n=1 Tax=Rhodococcus opacus TaxID=37919 RepID=UPI0021C9C768|nr:IS30 family transposase [Rhodococcus opacus]